LTDHYPVTISVQDQLGNSTTIASTAVVTAFNANGNAASLTGGLAVVVTNGPHVVHGFTNTNRPIFSGTAPAFSTVQIYSRHFHVDARIPIGEAVADASGHWTFTSGPLAAGIYVFAATVTIPGGYPSGLVPLKNADGTQLGYIGLTPRLARAILHHARAIPNLAGTHIPLPRMPKLSWPGHRRR
jgi:hypothetical protein